MSLSLMLILLVNNKHYQNKPAFYIEALSVILAAFSFILLI
jgi:hypothetical protein